MAKKFRVGQVVTINDGKTQRDAWTEPPDSRTVKVDDVPDGTKGVVVAILVGGYVYTVALPARIKETMQQVYALFAEEELLPSHPQATTQEK